MVRLLMVGRGSRFTKPRSERFCLCHDRLNDAAPASTYGGAVERCLACEAVVSKATALRPPFFCQRSVSCRLS